MNPYSATETICGRCKVPLPLADAERCWFCGSPLCGACWDEHGHCGHAQADEENRRARLFHAARHTLPVAALLLGVSEGHMRRLAADLGLRGRGQRVSDAQIEALRGRKTTPGVDAGTPRKR